jgi:hypothetical protein
VPRKGDIVRLKPGFDRTLEAVAAHRAGLPLQESARYDVLGYAQGELAHAASSANATPRVNPGCVCCDYCVAQATKAWNWSGMIRK